jgi:oligopeptide transport system ATP-binding protein
MAAQPLVRVNRLCMHFTGEASLFQGPPSVVKAVDGVTLEIQEGETLGLVGESGCGKSTLGRAILQLYRPTSGSVHYRDVNLVELEGKALREMRRRFQMIYQDPYASLNPRMKIADIVGEPMQIHKLCPPSEIRKRVEQTLEMVGLTPAFADRYPHEFSGGQRQRIGIARALAAEPDFIVADEPISALDVSIQAQIINLMRELQQQLKLTYLFIAHDLAVVRHISDRMAVMYLGKVVELTDSSSIYEEPLHPYTQSLLSAVPIPDPEKEREREANRTLLQGEVPSPEDPPSGCGFCTRCPRKQDVRDAKQIDCDVSPPALTEVKPGHWTACHLYS